MISGIFCIPTAWHVLIMTFMNAKVNYIVILLLVDFIHSKTYITFTYNLYKDSLAPPKSAKTFMELCHFVHN